MARDPNAYSFSRRSLCWTLAGVLVAPCTAIATRSGAFSTRSGATPIKNVV